jgi:hypothetical protein
LGKNRTNLVKTIDFTTKEELAKLEQEEQKREEARELARIKAEQEAEEKRKQEELQAEENRKIMRDINRKKFQDNPPPFKPSRLIDVDSDVAIMNIETMVTAIKESIEFLENKVWEIEDYIFRHDKKKRESLKLMKLKRKAKKR